VLHWASMARVHHAPTDASVAAGEAEREDSLWIMGGTWLILIDCLDFYHLNNFNSIISLEIIFYFIFTKIQDFFLSINRDLVHLIWTQKKKPRFSLSLSFY